MTKLPDPLQQQIVWIAVQIQVAEVTQGLGGSCLVELPSQEEASQDVCDLEIDQTRKVQCLLRRADVRSVTRTPFSTGRTKKRAIEGRSRPK